MADEGCLPGVYQGPGGVREEDHPRLADQYHLGTHHEAQAAIAGMDKDSIRTLNYYKFLYNLKY